MGRSFILLLTISILTFGCNLDNFDRYKGSINESLQSSNARGFSKSYKDVSNLTGCDVLVDLDSWQHRRRGNFGRDYQWFDGRINTYTGISLDYNISKGSSYYNDQANNHPIYIGPWQDTVLTKPSPFTLLLTNLFRSEEQKDQKLRDLDYRRTLKIRFFAYQDLETGDIRYSYESMNDDNKKIPAKEFSLSAEAKAAPKRFDLCVVKWIANFGYNAVAEVKSKNTFSKDYLVPTGRIIEVDQ